MGASKKIKKALIDKGITRKQLAELLGYRGTTTIYNMLARDNMTFENIERWADVIGCDVVLRDRETGRIYD